MGHVSLLAWAVIVVASAGISAGAILILRPILVRHLLAHPNARSSHKVPTPQGAGLAVMLAVLVVSALAAYLVPLLSSPKPRSRPCRSELPYFARRDRRPARPLRVMALHRPRIGGARDRA